MHTTMNISYIHTYAHACIHAYMHTNSLQKMTHMGFPPRARTKQNSAEGQLQHGSDTQEALSHTRLLRRRGKYTQRHAFPPARPGGG